MKPRIVILGGGPGGYAAAIRAAGLGAEATVIEQDGVGGVCLNRGCIPTKTMMFTARLFSRMQKAEEYGLEVNGLVRLDMARLMERKEKLVGVHAAGMLGVMHQYGIRYIEGRGRLTGLGKLSVTQKDGREVELEWDRLIFATGSEPYAPASLAPDGKRVLSTDDALTLREVPGTLLIVGGGVVGSEFAFLFEGLGSKVTLVEALPRVLPIPSVDEECSKVLLQEMKKRKIAFHANRKVERIEFQDGKARVTVGLPTSTAGLRGKQMAPLVETVDKVLVCTGRRPNTEGVGLEEMRIATDEKGWIRANERMETSVPYVYAIGDVLGPSKMMFAHAAAMEGAVAAENAMGANRARDYSAVPSAIFTVPEVGCVGLTELQAKERGFDAQSLAAPFRIVGKSHIQDEIAGTAKIVADSQTGRILGVHVVGAHAAELIAEGVLAVQTGRTVKELAGTVHAHPTLSEVLFEAASKR